MPPWHSTAASRQDRVRFMRLLLLRWERFRTVSNSSYIGMTRGWPGNLHTAASAFYRLQARVDTHAHKARGAADFIITPNPAPWAADNS